MDELIDILDENGNHTGKICLKSEAHKKGLWHPCVHIWLYTESGSVLIQKRSPKKEAFPNLWDVSVAGHIGAGEQPIIAAERELFEEVGYQVKENDFQNIGVFKTDYTHNELVIDREFHYIYIVKLDVSIATLKLQEEEVSEIKLVSVSELKEELKKTKAIRGFVSYSIDYFNLVFDAIKATLSSLNEKETNL